MSKRIVFPVRIVLAGTGLPDSAKKLPDTGEVYTEPCRLEDATGRWIRILDHVRDGHDFRSELARLDREARHILDVLEAHQGDEEFLADLEAILPYDRPWAERLAAARKLFGLEE